MDLRNPLAQVNLLIHLCMPYPHGDRIEPLLRQMGFSVYVVDRRISLPLEVYSPLKAALDIQPSCSPDVLMLNVGKTCALVCECKASSFGSETSQAVQARTLLLLTGTRIGDHFGVDSLRSSLVVFVLPGGGLELQRKCLGELSGQLRKLGQAPTDWQVWELVKRDDGIYLCNLSQTDCIDRTGDIRVVATDDPDEYEVLRVIPVDPSVDIQDPLGSQILQERLRSALAQSILGQLSSGDITISISISDLCSKIVLYVWSIWNPDSQKVLRSDVRRYVRDVLFRLDAFGVKRTPSSDPDRFGIEVATPRMAQEVRKFLLSSENRKTPFITGSQETLPFNGIGA